MNTHFVRRSGPYTSNLQEIASRVAYADPGTIRRWYLAGVLNCSTEVYAGHEWRPIHEFAELIPDEALIPYELIAEWIKIRSPNQETPK